MGSFTQKTIEVWFTLGAGAFAAGGNTKVVRQLATKASIKWPGLPDKNKATLTIVGMLPEDMATLTTLNFRPLEVTKNRVRVMVGDLGGTLTEAFAGEVTSAFADYNTAPDIAFTVEAMAGYFPSVTAEPPLSLRGDVPLAGVIERIAQGIGYGFENHGVTASLLNAVLNGSPIDKARAACNQCHVNLYIDNNILKIAAIGAVVAEPTGGALGDQSGLIGYPTFGSDGIKLKAYYRPDVVLGGAINVVSIVPKASGRWVISSMGAELMAHTPGSDNAWYLDIEATYGDLD